MCHPRGPGSKRSWLAETGPYRPGLFQIRATNYPRPPAGVGTGVPWDLQAPYLNRGPLQAQGLQGGLGGGRGLGCRPAQLGNLVDSGESGVGSPSKVVAMLLSPERPVSLPSWPGSQRGHRLGRPWRMGGAARDPMPWPSPSQAEQGGRGSQ